MEKKLKYPELEQDNYVAQVEAETAEAKKRAEQLEKQAKWDRDMALWGDMANLAAKGAAMHGGAWKINKDESAAAKGNERLRALQKENAAQLAAYAKQEVAARDAARKERNAQKLAQYNAELEAEKYAKEQERKDKQDALKAAETASTIAKNEAYTNYYNNGGRRTAGGGSGASNTPMPITFPNGRVKTFSKADNGDNWVNVAYEEAVAAGMPRLMRERTDAFGDIITYEATSLAERKAYMERWSAENAKNNTVEDWTPEEDEIIDYEP